MHFGGVVHIVHVPDESVAAGRTGVITGWLVDENIKVGPNATWPTPTVGRSIHNVVYMAHFFYIHGSLPTHFKNIFEAHVATQYMRSGACPDLEDP